jgi:hypothetical protein
MRALSNDRGLAKQTAHRLPRIQVVRCGAPTPLAVAARVGFGSGIGMSERSGELVQPPVGAHFLTDDPSSGNAYICQPERGRFSEPRAAMAPRSCGRFTANPRHCHNTARTIWHGDCLVSVEPLCLGTTRTVATITQPGAAAWGRAGRDLAAVTSVARVESESGPFV